MGLFDTVQLSRPIHCNSCKKIHMMTQTKLFDNSMTYYTVGDKLSTSTGLGILNEELYCDCGNSGLQEIFLVVYDHMLIATTEDITEAREIIKNPFQVLPDIYLKRRELHNHTMGALNRLSNTVYSYERYINSKSESPSKFDFFKEERELGDQFIFIKHKEIMEEFRKHYFSVFYAGYEYDVYSPWLPSNVLAKGIFGY